MIIIKILNNTFVVIRDEQ